MNKYLPCPFCASRDVRLFNCAGISVEVRCMNCSCAVSGGLVSSRGTKQAELDVAEKWNTRLIKDEVILVDTEMKTTEKVENKAKTVPITTEEIMRGLNVAKGDTPKSQIPGVADGAYDGPGVYEKAREPTCIRVDMRKEKK